MNALRPTAQKKIFLSNYSTHWQCPWPLRSSDGEEQRDECCFHGWWHNIHSAVHGSRRNYYFQVLLFKKHISLKAKTVCHRPWFLWWAWAIKSSPLKTYWKEFMNLSAIKNSRGSWEGDNISTLTRVWKKLVPTLMDDFAEVQDLSGGRNYKCGGNRKRTRIRNEVWRWDWSAASHDETWRMRSCFLWMSKEGGFLRWNLLLVKILWRWLKW